MCQDLPSCAKTSPASQLRTASRQDTRMQSCDLCFKHRLHFLILASCTGWYLPKIPPLASLNSATLRPLTCAGSWHSSCRFCTVLGCSASMFQCCVRETTATAVPVCWEEGGWDLWERGVRSCQKLLPGEGTLGARWLLSPPKPRWLQMRSSSCLHPRGVHQAACLLLENWHLCQYLIMARSVTAGHHLQGTPEAVRNPDVLQTLSAPMPTGLWSSFRPSKRLSAILHI